MIARIGFYFFVIERRHKLFGKTRNKGHGDSGKLSRYLVTLILAWPIFCTALLAQVTSTIIESSPPGAAIVVEGEYYINATTPCRLPDNITGLYRVEATLPGYESWNGEILIVPGHNNRFAFSLSAKTRLKSALRSIFWPGWGQYYAGQKTRGSLLSAAVLGLGVGTLIADADFRKKRDDYDRARLDLANAISADEIMRLREVVIDKNRQAYDAETTRNVVAIAAAAVYGYNVLDALIFFPERKLNFQMTVPPETPGVSAIFDGNKIGVRLCLSF